MLAVPASAFALTGATPASGQTHDTTLGLTVSPHHVRFGDAVRVTGTAPATDDGRRVVLEEALPHGVVWRPVARSTIGQAGHFAFHALLRHSGRLRAVEVGMPANGAPIAQIAGAAARPTGETPTVTVDSRLALRARRHDLLSGQPVVLVGKLLPVEAGQLLRLQGRAAGAWRTLDRGRTGRAGGFRLGYRPAADTGRRLRVLFGGDRSHGGAAALAGTVTAYRQTLASWYDDGGTTACGFHAGLGVANRSLPCGTRVHFRYGGRSVTAVVDDRGPYVGGREWDLNQNTAAALGFAGVGTVWSAAS
jgi:rare lipoprotein A